MDSPAAAWAGPSALHSLQGMGRERALALGCRTAKSLPTRRRRRGGTQLGGTKSVWSREGRGADCDISSEKRLDCKLQLKGVGGGELKTVWIRARRGSKF